MKMVTVSEAKSKLSALINSAEHGEQVLIMRGSRPSVTLTPVDEDAICLSPEFSAKALHAFEDEIASERKARKLTRLGSSPKEAGQTLKRVG